MATFTVSQFDSAEGAGQVLATLERLQKEDLIKIEDAAIVTWPEGAKKPKTKQLHNLAGAGALGGAFWGMLFGLIFFVPLLGLAVGAASGALGGALTDVGIDDNFIKEVRSKVTPGTSALFLMTSETVPDKVAEELKSIRGHVTLLHTNLSTEQEEKLRETFAEQEAPTPAAV
jgi:uncharacterized membrane protein